MKILIVDDKQESRFMLNELLTNKRYDTLEAENGLIALEVARKHRPQLVISDIQMPEMDGFQLCEQMKADPNLKDIAFVFYTSVFEEPEDERLAMDLGASLFIHKPTETEEFLKIIESLLDQQRSGELHVPAGTTDSENKLRLRHEHRLITQLHKKVQQLESTKHSLDTLMCNLPGMVYRCRNNQSWTMDFISNACLKITGYSQEALINSQEVSYGQLIHEDDRDRIFKEVQAAIKSDKPFQLEYRVRHRDGSIKWIWEQGVCTNPGAEPELLEGYITDVTVQKKATEERNRFFDLSLDLLCIAGTDGYFKQLNPAWSKVLGWSEAEILARPWLELVHPDDHNNTEQARIDLTDGNQVLSFENRFLAKDGSYRWLSWSSMPLPEEGLMYGVAHDITDRKQAEENLIKNETRFRNFFEQAPLAYQSLDEEGRLIAVNQNWRETLGYQADEVLGHPFADFLSDEYKPGFVENFNNFKTAGEVHGVYFEMVCKDGSLIEVEFDGRVGRDSEGKFLQTHCLLNNLTQQKSVEAELRKAKQVLELSNDALEQKVIERTEALRKAELKYRTVADFTYDWETWDDKEGLVVYSSPAAERVTGYPAQMFIDRPQLLVEIVHPEDASIVKEHFKHHAVDYEPATFQFRIIRKDGSQCWIEHVCQAVYDETGQLNGRRASNRDVTDRVKAEQALVMARDDAEASARAKADFLSNMSHEIRTPMNAVLGLTHLLQQGQLAPKQRDQLTKIQRAGKHLLMLINDILDLSKIDAGKLELEQVSFRVDGLLGNVASMLSEQVERKGLEFIVDNDIPPLNMLGDATRLTQILINLAGNAIKFTDQGSITLRISMTKEIGPDIEFCFEVIDTGIGISEEQQAHLFSAFDQADTSINRKYGGTGLGLALSMRLINAMDGTIGLDSKLGEGSRFWFTVSLARVEGSQVAVARPIEEDPEALLKQNYRDTHILLAEDNFINQEVTVSMLEGAGLKVSVANNGAEAIEIMKQKDNTVELVLMDMQMPVMDGLEATRQIRQFPEGKSIPILAMTANAFAEDRDACDAAGMNDFIVKPVDPIDLYTVVLKWLLNKERK